MDSENTRKPLGDEDDCRSTSNPTKKCKSEIPELINLCDDILLSIFKFLSYDDLIEMPQIHSKLARISVDWALRKHIRIEKFYHFNEKIYLEYVKKYTTQLILNRTQFPTHDYYVSTISRNFILKLKKKCPQLKHLTLSNHKYDAVNISLDILPSKLTSLEFEKTVISNIPPHSYFRNIDQVCKDLTEVQITFNDWFSPLCLTMLGALEKLSYLSLQGCKQLHRLIYPCHLVFNGLKSLETLDLRLSTITDSGLQCFARLENLKYVLLERPAHIVNVSDSSTISNRGLEVFCHTKQHFNPEFHYMYRDKSGEVHTRIVEARNNFSGLCTIKSLYVRNYPLVNDDFLKTAASAAPFIKFIDVTGTSCTQEEVENFKTKRPDTEIFF